MKINLIFFLKFIILGIATVFIMPKTAIKKFFSYGLVLGGFAYILINLIITSVLHLAKYTNMGQFGIYGLFSYCTPISYSLVMMLYLYLMPKIKILYFLYTVAFALFGYCLGVMLENYDAFHYLGVWRYLAPVGLFVWFRIAAWVYLKYERLRLAQENR